MLQKEPVALGRLEPLHVDIVGVAFALDDVVGAGLVRGLLERLLAELLGAQAPDWVDGRSLAGILGTGTTPEGWRTAALSESMGRSTPGDPDYQAQAPPSFGALRTQQWLFVVYRDGERELYDLAADPHEQNNIAATADPTLVAGLYSQLQAMRACSGPSCLTADSIPLPQPTS
ncbi:MAG: N-acetylglucosamine-6-sulfatase [Actinomycetota bacterium]|nr:N-acetylglucosamine-6-sulfatase [Actinomycetota bacterium]